MILRIFQWYKHRFGFQHLVVSSSALILVLKLGRVGVLGCRRESLLTKQKYSLRKFAISFTKIMQSPLLKKNDIKEKVKFEIFILSTKAAL